MTDKNQESRIKNQEFESLPYVLARKLISIALIFGLIGGAGGSYLWLRYGSASIPAKRLTQVIQENSAIIDVAKKVSPSVVSITTQSTGFDFFFGRKTQQAAGTGIIVTSDGLILTNKHVVEGAQTLSVFTSDGKEYKGGKVVAIDTVNDIAFVKITATGLRAAELADSSSVIVGQQVVAIGNALGQFQNTVTQGIISGLGRPIEAGDQSSSESLQNLLQTDAAINPGNSGGPLVNLSGQVIGINTAIAGNAQNIGFAIPINDAKPLITSVKASGKIMRPYLGVRYVAITKEFAAQNNFKVSDGAFISGGNNQLAILPDSPASKAGLQEGDIITKIGGAKIDASHSLTTLISKYKVGDKVAITYLRDGQSKTVEVTLEAAPSS